MRPSLLALAIVAVGCSADPPGTVDEESVALDVAACARHQAGCITSNGAQPTEILEPGADTAISLPAGASISGPIQRPFDGKLAWLALGTRAGYDGKLQIQVGDATPIVIHPAAGYSRVEISMANLRPKTGAVITLTAVTGQVDLAWVVGRWMR